MSGDKDEMGDIQSSLEWGRKMVSAMDTHGIGPASSRIHRPLPWCILEHRRPQRSRNTHSHHLCRRSRSHAHRPHRRPWGPPRRETSMCVRPALPLESLDHRTLKLAHSPRVADRQGHTHIQAILIDRSVTHPLSTSR